MKQIMTVRGMQPEYWIAKKENNAHGYSGVVYYPYQPHNILYSDQKDFLILQWQEGVSSPILIKGFDTREEAEKELLNFQ